MLNGAVVLNTISPQYSEPARIAKGTASTQGIMNQYLPTLDALPVLP
jgi:hypothetical protein